MDSFEFNKIAGAVLGTALGVMALSIVSEMIYTPAEAEQPGYVIAVAEPGGGEVAGGGGKVEIAPIAERLQTADIAKGASAAKKCLACHTLEKGQPAKVGPNLYGVVGAPAAHMEGFKYSQAMLAKRDEGVTWSFENLDHFIANPKGFVAGTAMSFAGVKKPDERADVIAYLNSLSDNPLPLPSTTAEAQPAAPAAGAAAPAAETPAAPAAETPASGTTEAPAAGTTPPAAETPAVPPATAQ